MSMTITGTHPFADRFPMLPEDELQRLADDIAENGLQHPVILDRQGRILDGRNREAACQRINVTPEVEVYDGDDAAAFVLSQNVARRHLTTGQQAMSTALVLADAGKRKSGRWERGAVAATSGSGSSDWPKRVAEAGAVLDHAPDLADAVASGGLALDAAYRQAEQRRDAERQQLERAARIAAEEADAKAFVEQSAPDLAALVGSTLETYAEARAVWEKRNREEADRLRREKAEQERAAKAERDNEIQEVSTVAGALIRLEHLQHADRRAYTRDCFDKHLAEVPPVQRDCHTPEFIAALAGWLNEYAAELKENQR